MTKYTKDITNNIKDYLINFNLIFDDKYILLDFHNDNILHEVFGLDDNFYEVFNVEYMVKRQLNYFNEIYYLYHKDIESPVASVEVEYGENIIRVGHAHEVSKDGLSPVWYLHKSKNEPFCNLPEISDILNNIVHKNIKESNKYLLL